eukprot:1155006-Pelagomonas_calceolata.AAC.3
MIHLWTKRIKGTEVQDRYGGYEGTEVQDRYEMTSSLKRVHGKINGLWTEMDCLLMPVLVARTSWVPKIRIRRVQDQCKM